MEKGNKSKRKPKTPIKFKYQLAEDQKEAKALILRSEITILRGKAGSGKTLLGVQTALDLLFTRQVEKIFIARPAVSKEEMGFLPGDIREKMDPWLAPVMNNMYDVYGKEKIEKCIEEGTIEIAPLAYMRGRTFAEAFVVVDECQNITDEQMHMVVTRLGKESKMVLCGDLDQCDLPRGQKTGLEKLRAIVEKVEGMSEFTLQTNHRAPIVKEILEHYEVQGREYKIPNTKD